MTPAQVEEWSSCEMAMNGAEIEHVMLWLRRWCHHRLPLSNRAQLVELICDDIVNAVSDYSACEVPLDINPDAITNAAARLVRAQYERTIQLDQDSVDWTYYGVVPPKADVDPVTPTTIETNHGDNHDQ